MLLKMVRNSIKMISSLSYKKDKSIVLLGAWFGERYADNSRFLYEYLTENKEKLKLKHVVWATRNKGIYSFLKENNYECCLIGTPESKKWHKKAYYHIICNAPTTIYVTKGTQKRAFLPDLETMYSYRAKRINLWHGASFKKVGFISNEFQKNKRKSVFTKIGHELLIKMFITRKVMMEGGWVDSYHLTTGWYDSQIHYLSAACKKTIETNYPRNGRCILIKKEEENVIKKIKEHRKSVIYLPTFNSTNNSQDEVFDETFRYKLNENDILFIYKSHFAEIKQDDSKINCNEIVILNPNFDIYSILQYVDIVISDYSSVVFDAIYYGQKVVYFIPLYEEYLKGNNGLIVPFEMIQCGPVVKRLIDIFPIIRGETMDEKDEFYKKNYDRLKKVLWPHNDSIEEIWDKIVNA